MRAITIIAIMLLGIVQLDAFLKRSVVYTRRTILFAWEEEAIKGFVTLGTLAIYVAVSDKRISDAAAASEKRFSDLISSHSNIRSADKDTLNAIVKGLSADLKSSNDRLSTEIKASNDRVDREIKASNERLEREIKASNEQTAEDIKQIKDVVAELGEILKRSMQRKGFFKL